MNMDTDVLNDVNPLQGTDSDPMFSRGNTWPLVARPFGMTHWCPQTDEGAWQFTRRATRLQGVRATHRPMPWLGDYGHFTVMAEVGGVIHDASRRASLYRQDEAVFKPHYFRALLCRYQTTIEVTPTERCACFRLTFPATEQAQILLETPPAEASLRIDPATGAISGYTRARSYSAPENFAGYFVAVPDRVPKAWGLYAGDDCRPQEVALEGLQAGAWLTFATNGDEQITLRVATSFISVEQAWRNLMRELGDRPFDDVRDESAARWERELSRITIEGATPAQRTIFYSCLYRAFLFPRKCHECDAAGKMIHYSPYDGQVHEGEMCADNGFWDTYRTVYPLLSLIAPSHVGEIMRGWTNAMREGGWTPKWSNPGYDPCMIGTHLDTVVADTYLRGIRDFDIETAYRVIRRDAIEVSPTSAVGREGLASYLALGYVAADEMDRTAARTQDYAYNDWGIAQVARALGYTEEANLLYQRALNYRNTFDPAVNFMRGRRRDGSWVEPFDPLDWGGAFVEGSAWQGTWAVQHDPEGLIALMGGREVFLAKLDEMLTLPPHYHTTTLQYEIHEMSEMAAVDFGQYAQSNQPVHHVLYLYTCAGQPWKTQYWVRRVMDELYSPAAFPGDEDTGEMGGWYVLNALGMYPLCPGHPSFVLGSPLFSRATITLENGNTLTIDAPGNNRHTVYVHQVTWQGQQYSRTWISHADLLRGGMLTFAMGAMPNIDCIPTGDNLPYSLSRDQLA